MVPMYLVVAGEYADTAPLAVCAELADAEKFASLYNAEHGHGLEDGDRAQVEGIRSFSAGDPGASGHEVRVEYIPRRRASSGWAWACACGRHDETGSEQRSREQAARHLAHWGVVPERPALP